MLKIKDLNIKRGDKEVLRNFSVDIKTNISTAVVGPSGCGKSSLLKCLLGVFKAISGEVLFKNKVYQNEGLFVPVEKRDFGIVFQDLILFEHLSVLENISYGLGDKNDPKALEMAKVFGLENHINKKSALLSGGEKQRLALARAIAPAPEYLLLDETFSSLDPILRKQIRNEIKAIFSKLKIGSLLVTHDMADVLDFAEELIVIDEKGVLVQSGPVNDIANKPFNAYVASLFD